MAKPMTPGELHAHIHNILNDIFYSDRLNVRVVDPAVVIDDHYIVSCQDGLFVLEIYGGAQPPVLAGATFAQVMTHIVPACSLRLLAEFDRVMDRIQTNL